MSKQIKAPSPLLLALEPVRTGLEALSMAIMRPHPRVGSGQPVIVYPGLATNEYATALFRNRLQAAGFSVYDWEQGLNRGPRGDFESWLSRLAEQIHALEQLHSQAVSLVGWSLGGIFARELSKRVPSKVAQVITLGTPFAAQADSTNAAKVYELLNGSAPDFSKQFLAAIKKTPVVPTTSVYSKTDGVVAWECCLEKETETSQSIELSQVSHFGMVFNPASLRLVARILAQPHGQWRRLGEQECREPSSKSARTCRTQVVI